MNCCLTHSTYEALPSKKQRDAKNAQADGMSVRAIYMACIGLYKIERAGVNSFRWLHYETYQRRIPIYREPVR
jgi:hypothetical protein